MPLEGCKGCWKMLAMAGKLPEAGAPAVEKVKLELVPAHDSCSRIAAFFIVRGMPLVRQRQVCTCMCFAGRPSPFLQHAYGNDCACCQSSAVEMEKRERAEDLSRLGIRSKQYSSGAA